MYRTVGWYGTATTSCVGVTSHGWSVIQWTIGYSGWLASWDRCASSITVAGRTYNTSSIHPLSPTSPYSQLACLLACRYFDTLFAHLAAHLLVRVHHPPVDQLPITWSLIILHREAEFRHLLANTQGSCAGCSALNLISRWNVKLHHWNNASRSYDGRSSTAANLLKLKITQSDRITDRITAFVNINDANRCLEFRFRRSFKPAVCTPVPLGHLCAATIDFFHSNLLTTLCLKQS